MATTIILNSMRHLPAIDVPQFCTGAPKPVPEHVDKKSTQLTVPSPVLLAMGVPNTHSSGISDDGKSLIARNLGWTWTFTPSVVPS